VGDGGGHLNATAQFVATFDIVIERHEEGCIEKNIQLEVTALILARINFWLMYKTIGTDLLFRLGLIYLNDDLFFRCGCATLSKGPVKDTRT
jgi:hypothetical protein